MIYKLLLKFEKINCYCYYFIININTQMLYILFNYFENKLEDLNILAISDELPENIIHYALIDDEIIKNIINKTDQYYYNPENEEHLLYSRSVYDLISDKEKNKYYNINNLLLNFLKNIDSDSDSDTNSSWQSDSESDFDDEYI